MRASCWIYFLLYSKKQFILKYSIHLSPFYYRPQRSCGQGNIFTPVCHSFCSRGGGLPQCMLGYHHHPPPGSRPPPEQTPPKQTPPLGPDTPRSRHTPLPPPGADTPPREADSSIRSTSGRYASYWNAFLYEQST